MKRRCYCLCCCIDVVTCRPFEERSVANREECTCKRYISPTDLLEVEQVVAILTESPRVGDQVLATQLRMNLDHAQERVSILAFSEREGR